MSDRKLEPREQPGETGEQLLDLELGTEQAGHVTGGIEPASLEIPNVAAPAGATRKEGPR